MPRGLGIFYIICSYLCFLCRFLRTFFLFSSIKCEESLNIYLIHIWKPERNYHSRSEWIWERLQWMGTPHSINLLNWNLTIKCSLVSYPEHLLFLFFFFFFRRGSYPSAGDTVSIFLAQLTEQSIILITKHFNYKTKQSLIYKAHKQSNWK